MDIQGNAGGHILTLYIITVYMLNYSIYIYYYIYTSYNIYLFFSLFYFYHLYFSSAFGNWIIVHCVFSFLQSHTASFL